MKSPSIYRAESFWSSVKNTHFYPQAYIRLGRVDKIFGEMSFARNFPSSFPDLVFQTNIGFSVKYNKLNSGVVRLGTSTNTGLFISSTFPIGKYFLIEPYVGFLTPVLGAAVPFNQEEDRAKIGSIALHYELAKRPRPN